MVHPILNAALGMGGAKFRSAVIAAGALASMAGMPASALAHHHGFHLDVIIPGAEVVAPVPPCSVAPAANEVWVPAVYQTVTERVWVEPVTTTQIQRVEVPAQYGWRDVVFYDYYGYRHIRREQVEISPAHYVDQPVQVVVTRGHFEDQTHQQLVCAGHWEVQQPVTVQTEGRVEIPLPF